MPWDLQMSAHRSSMFEPNNISGTRVCVLAWVMCVKGTAFQLAHSLYVSQFVFRLDATKYSAVCNPLSVFGNLKTAIPIPVLLHFIFASIEFAGLDLVRALFRNIWCALRYAKNHGTHELSHHLRMVRNSLCSSETSVAASTVLLLELHLIFDLFTHVSFLPIFTCLSGTLQRKVLKQRKQFRMEHHWACRYSFQNLLSFRLLDAILSTLLGKKWRSVSNFAVLSKGVRPLPIRQLLNACVRKPVNFPKRRRLGESRSKGLVLPPLKMVTWLAILRIFLEGLF